MYNYKENENEIKYIEFTNVFFNLNTSNNNVNNKNSVLSSINNKDNNKDDNKDDKNIVKENFAKSKIFINLFIISYNNDKALNRALETLFSSDFINYKNTQVNIINNYSSIKVNIEYINNYNINIIHNQTRGNHFNPNLSENHNQAILFGFENLNDPKSEIVIHTHNDIQFCKTWVSELIKCMDTYNTVFGSVGDQFVAYKVDAIKKVGLWDENFPGLVHNECDYMLRSFLLNRTNIYINDPTHGRELNNKIKYNFDDQDVTKRNIENEKLKTEASVSGDLNEFSKKYFYEKWKNCAEDLEPSYNWLVKWNKISLLEKLKKLPHVFKLFCKYPFFECNIETLKQQNYLLLDDKEKIIEQMRHEKWVLNSD